MKRINKIFNFLKKVNNVDDDELYDEDQIEFDDELENNENDNKEFSEENEDENNEIKQREFRSFLFKRKNEKIEEETEENEEIEDDNTGYSPVIFTFQSLDDCYKIVNYIKREKVITLNFEKANKKVMQKALDFLSGAMSVKNASYTKITENVYTILPEWAKVRYEGATKKEDKIVSLEREDI